jgi:hypothetical protein
VVVLNGASLRFQPLRHQRRHKRRSQKKTEEHRNETLSRQGRRSRVVGEHLVDPVQVWPIPCPTLRALDEGMPAVNDAPSLFINNIWRLRIFVGGRRQGRPLATHNSRRIGISRNHACNLLRRQSLNSSGQLCRAEHESCNLTRLRLGSEPPRTPAAAGISKRVHPPLAFR